MKSVPAIADQFVESVTSVEPFGTGHINETFLVHTIEGDYVLQRINRVVFHDVDAVMANMLAAHRHLSGRLMPEPVLARSGEWLVHDGDDVWRSWKRVPDAEPAAAPTVANAESAARLLARFHSAVADLDPRTLTVTLAGFHDPGRRVAALRDVVRDDPCARAHDVTDEIAMAFACAPLVDRAAEFMARVPPRVAHNDAKLDNVLFRDGEAVCLVDFDTLMLGAWFWDLGDLLRTASTSAAEDEPHPDDVRVDRALYDAVIGGYCDGISETATPAEMDALESAGAIVTFEQAVRFLTDWIAGDLYYRTSRPDQNRDRARAQFRLLASMPGTVTAS